MADLEDRLAKIRQWIQREDDELLYTPQYQTGSLDVREQPPREEAVDSTPVPQTPQRNLAENCYNQLLAAQFPSLIPEYVFPGDRPTVAENRVGQPQSGETQHPMAPEVEAVPAEEITDELALPTNEGVQWRVIGVGTINTPPPDPTLSMRAFARDYFASRGFDEAIGGWISSEQYQELQSLIYHAPGPHQHVMFQALRARWLREWAETLVDEVPPASSGIPIEFRRLYVVDSVQRLDHVVRHISRQYRLFQTPLTIIYIRDWQRAAGIGPRMGQVVGLSRDCRDFFDVHRHLTTLQPCPFIAEGDMG